MVTLYGNATGAPLSAIKPAPAQRTFVSYQAGDGAAHLLCLHASKWHGGLCPSGPLEQ